MSPLATVGKKRIIKLLTSSSNELAMPQYQKLLRRMNNCNATSWACSACHLPQQNICMNKFRMYLQTEALKEHKDKPEYRKEQARLGFPIP